MVTNTMLLNWAANNDVAICVLSPISTKKKASNVVKKMPPLDLSTGRCQVSAIIRLTLVEWRIRASQVRLKHRYFLSTREACFA